MTNESNEQTELDNVNFGQLPIGKNEDVEYSEELADEGDRKAQQRANEADAREQGE
ncbi:YfhD family protein [Paenibacillus paeoniae]|uniref:YfhD family protein n=1 Tax=Paenibacillus paeoniae TaxID=2292705 RepID=A0A371PMJ8_9BACL|nr:YfhD family protein [Paenibacillus paeoniae]REK77424.1 YfhD family protein [Paenibacillus paeoniae]